MLDHFRALTERYGSSLPLSYAEALSSFDAVVREHRLTPAETQEVGDVYFFIDPAVAAAENEEVRAPREEEWEPGVDQWPEDFLVIGLSGLGDVYFIDLSEAHPGVGMWSHEVGVFAHYDPEDLATYASPLEHLHSVCSQMVEWRSLKAAPSALKGPSFPSPLEAPFAAPFVPVRQAHATNTSADSAVLHSLFFRVEAEVSTRATGPVLRQVDIAVYRDGALTFGERLRPEAFPEPPPVLIGLPQTRAKLTDLMSQTNVEALGLLVSARMRDLLTGFRLAEHRYYKVAVETSTGVIPYYFLHFLGGRERLEWVDFARSTFWLTRDTLREDEEVPLASLQEYEALKEQPLMGAKIKQGVLSEAFDSTLDLFRIPEIYYGILASQRLVEALREAGMSGVEVKPAPIALVSAN